MQEFREPTAGFPNHSATIPFVLPSAIGSIVSWVGSIANIPARWSLCDGTNGTPDLRNRFVVGAGDTYAPGNVGGAGSHNHDATIDNHNHTTKTGVELESGTDIFSTSTSTVDGAFTDTDNNLAPWYALAYIMHTGE